MNERLNNCELCKTPNSLKRIPSSVLLGRKDDSFSTKTGDVVKSAIADGKEALKQEKERLKNNFFELENE